MLRATIVGSLLLIAALACSGDEAIDSTSAPTSEPTSTPSSTNVGQLGPDEHWFIGVVREVNSGCVVDAICSVSVEVLKHIGGGALPGGETFEVIETFGFSTRRCLGDWNSSLQVGDQVEVVAGDEDDERLQICDQERYFIKDDHPHPSGTPTPTLPPPP